MGRESIKILHIDTERTWRGGQQQAIYLLEGLLKRSFSTMLVCQPKSALAEYCQQKRLPFLPIRMHGEADILAGNRIANFARKNGYEIIHLHSSHSISIGLWVKLFNSSVKLIAVRRVDFPISKNLFSQFKYRTRWLSKIVCISQGIMKILLDQGIPKSKLVVIHSGINLEKFASIQRSDDFRKQWHIPIKNILIGTVAAMVGHKDYPNLLNAAKIVLSRHADVTFCAIGSGPDQREIQQQAADLELGNQFIFFDFQKDIRNFLKNFDIFVLASSLEGLGTSILDAQAVGLPIVATETGGIPDAVQNGVNGLLVPPKSAEALAGALESLIKNPELREKFGKNGLQSVKKFAIEHTVQKNIELYHQLGY